LSYIKEINKQISEVHGKVHGQRTKQIATHMSGVTQGPPRAWAFLLESRAVVVRQ